MNVEGSQLAAYPAMKAHGFRAVGDNSVGYCLLSDSREGCKVYIVAAIAEKFASWLTRSGYKGAVVMSRLAQLRATTGGLKSCNNTSNAFEYIDIIENLQIGYKIIQTSVDNRRSAVYITRIDFIDHAEGDITPGLYNVDYKATRDEWVLDRKEQAQIRRSNMAINGNCRHAEVAARDIMPEMVNETYKDVSSSQGIKDEGFGLFYSPRPLYSGDQHGKTAQHNQVSFEVSANKLDGLMLAAQKEGRTTQWVIHGDGCHLFRQTSRRLRGQTLDKHTVFFAAPKGNFQTLLPLVWGAGLKLHEEVFKYHPHDCSQPLNRINPRISKEIRKFGRDYKGIAMTALMNAQSSVEAVIGYLLLASAAAVFMFTVEFDGWIVGSGVLAVVVVVIVAIFAIITAATVVAVAVEKFLELRNILASYANDPILNPHMSPFKSAIELYVLASSENRARGGSFLELVKRLCRKTVQRDCAVIKKLLLWPSIHKRLPTAWQASKLNIYGPDFERAPWKELNLSGIKLKFKNPSQTEMFLNNIRVRQMAIYKNQSYSPPWDGGRTRTLYKSGWVYTDGLSGDGVVGGGILQMIVQRRDLKKYGLQSLFIPEQLAVILLDDFEKDYGERNRQLREGDYLEPYNPEVDIWLYPKTVEELNPTEHRGLTCYSFSIWQPFEMKRYTWVAAITDEHLLEFSYMPSASGVHHLADDNNFAEVVERTVREFTENLYITLTPDAERQRQAALSKASKLAQQRA
ncbi:hypothetical protein ACJJIK_11665 [Microbulbifer sp. ZKSA006]|uniref:hypothetical protein n=1 Tax=Microbulbifer sp. ZKSA006 TaxID=3243390 RepID=UPI00403A706F